MSVLLKTTEVEVRHEHQTNVWCDYRLVDFRTNNLVVLLYKCPGSTTRISVTMAGSIRRQLYIFWYGYHSIYSVWCGFFFVFECSHHPSVMTGIHTCSSSHGTIELTCFVRLIIIIGKHFSFVICVYVYRQNKRRYNIGFW